MVYALFSIMVFLLICLVLVYLFMVTTTRMLMVGTQPVQRVHVKIAGKRGEASKVFATFEMPDGTEKEMRLVDPRFYEPLKIDDTGMLIYRELGNSKNARHREFIWFVKDPNIDG